MIAKSDLIILVVSTTALSVGLYRWQQDSASPRITTARPAPPLERAVDAMPNDLTPAVAKSLARGAADAAPTVENGAVRVQRVPVDAEGDPNATGTDTSPRSAGANVLDAAPAAADTLAGSSSNADKALYGRYVVRNGDYLGRLANRFGTSVATLQSINDLDGTTIHVDDELLYPLPAN